MVWKPHVAVGKIIQIHICQKQHSHFFSKPKMRYLDSYMRARGHDNGFSSGTKHGGQVFKPNESIRDLPDTPHTMMPHRKCASMFDYAGVSGSF